MMITNSQNNCIKLKEIFDFGFLFFYICLSLKHNPLMKTRKINVFILPLLILITISTSGKTINPPSAQKALSCVAQPFINNSLMVEVHKLSSEINNGKSCEYPLYISELNNGLIYCTEIKNGDNITSEREFYFSKYDSTLKTWLKPINIKKDYAKFCEENKIMNFEEIFVTIDNDIYVVNLKSKEFTAEKLNINTKGVEASPILSPDGITLYFVSDRKGGFGGKDIWASERLSNGNWSEPYNLGKDINTAEDEESPYIMLDGVTLYFSSKGHGSYGGYDIFMATQDYDGLWSKPENLGAPVNSTSDDYYYITDSFGKKAYYSSDKSEKGNQDIFSVQYNSFGK